VITRKGRLAIASLALISFTAASCGGDDGEGSGAAETTAAAGGEEGTETTAAESGGTETTAAGEAGGTIGVILPDSASSARWETADRPLLEEAITAAGFEADIQNAEGDPQQMATIADGMIAAGVKVLMIVNLDSASGAEILSKAREAGIPTIDYDRLTLGGGADVYVSFDNVAVGTLQGEGLVQCIEEAGVTNPEIAVLNGSPTDNNATLFKEGYDSVINPLFESGEWTEVDDQSVPDWDNQEGGRIFQDILAQNGGTVDGVLAANDGLGGAAIAVLQQNNLQVPVTGQDATLDGLRSILAGDQCMTVYKAIRVEAEAAAAAAIALASGEEPETTGTVTDTETGEDVPSVLATPVAIFRDNVIDVVEDDFVDRDELCADLEEVCTELGI
jgi:D-xylose transport system substrate-binding protein